MSVFFLKVGKQGKYVSRKYIPLQFHKSLVVQTAELFARSTGQEISEELASMRNRQHIQKLVLDGRIGEAISTTQQLYPGLLRNNQDLLFRLKVVIVPHIAFSDHSHHAAMNNNTERERDNSSRGWGVKLIWNLFDTPS